MPLKAEAISKRSKTAWLLRDVSFEAARGEILGIFGPNGSGKSILLQVISGREKPNGGRVTLDEVALARTSGSTIQYFGPHPSDGLIDRLSAVFHTGGAVDPADIVSAAIASDAHAILLDHIFCGLDREGREREFERLRGAARELQKIVIVASANFEEVLSFCDKAVVLHKGETLQDGIGESIYLGPASSVVAELTGRCNIFEARRTSSSKAEVPEFQTIAGGHNLLAGRTEKARLGALNRNIRLAIRPEHISIAFGASFPDDNLIKAVVKQVRFLGPSTLVSLDAGGLGLEALVMRLVGLEPGGECMLGLPPDRIMVFAD